MSNKVLCEKRCGVCEDKAIGRNFGAITCESCKAFFRRAALKNKIMNCSFENRCEINPMNRKSCKKCRLVRCYEIGMKKELIVKRGDNASNNCSRSQKTKTKRQRCDTSESHDSSTSFTSLYSSEWTSVSEVSLTQTEEPEDKDLLIFGNDFEAMMESCCLSEDEINSELLEMDHFLSDPELNDNVYEEDEQLATSSLSAIVRPIATFDKEFNEIEMNRLLELKTASEEINDFSGTYKYSISVGSVREMFEKFSALGLFDQIIESVVRFSKRMSTFKDVCQDDQITLIKNGHTAIMNLKYLTRFDFDEEDEECFEYVVNSEFSVRCYLNVFKLEEEKSYNATKNFLKSLPKDWKYDTTLINLMMAIALFNDTTKLVHCEMAKLNRQMYLYLLQRYLIQKFRSEDKSSENLSRALRKLMELHNMHEICKEVCSRHTDVLTPLAKEVYDL